MLDEIKRSSQFEPYVAIIQQYHRTLKAWFSSNWKTYAQVHRELRRRGSNVVEATVSMWIRGKVMAPDDPENLSRMLDILNISDPSGELSEAINKAAVKLRNVYRIYAKTVNAFLIKAAGEDHPEVDDLLRKYNLDIAAVRDSVIKEKVVEISSDLFPLSASIAGRLYGY